MEEYFFWRQCIEEEGSGSAISEAPSAGFGLVRGLRVVKFDRKSQGLDKEACRMGARACGPSRVRKEAHRWTRILERDEFHRMCSTQISSTVVDEMLDAELRRGTLPD